MRFIFRIIFSLALFLIAGIIATYVLFIIAGRKATNITEDFSPDITRINDGLYQGEFTFLGVTRAKVAFEIRKGKLVELSFEKLSETPGYGAAFTIISVIKSNSKLDFDAVSGATITSNFAKAAIKDALSKK